MTTRAKKQQAISPEDVLPQGPLDEQKANSLLDSADMVAKYDPGEQVASANRKKDKQEVVSPPRDGKGINDLSQEARGNKKINLKISKGTESYVTSQQHGSQVLGGGDPPTTFKLRIDMDKKSGKFTTEIKKVDGGND